MMQIVPRWRITINLRDPEEGLMGISYIIDANSLNEILQWISKLSFKLSIINSCNIERIE